MGGKLTLYSFFFFIIIIKNNFLFFLFFLEFFTPKNKQKKNLPLLFFSSFLLFFSFFLRCAISNDIVFLVSFPCCILLDRICFSQEAISVFRKSKWKEKINKPMFFPSFKTLLSILRRFGELCPSRNAKS